MRTWETIEAASGSSALVSLHACLVPRARAFLATDLGQGENRLDPEEQGLVCREFSVRAVENMILDRTLKDGTTVAAFGLPRLKGLL